MSDSIVALAPDAVQQDVSAPKITGYQWKGFIGAFGGWLLDGFELSIFGLVMAPALTELLPASGYRQARRP